MEDITECGCPTTNDARSCDCAGKYEYKVCSYEGHDDNCNPSDCIDQKNFETKEGFTMSYESRLAFITEQKRRQTDLRKLCSYCHKPLWGVVALHDPCVAQFESDRGK